jgi:pimeloyl-ACP methyl ester carboxylesterase
MNIKCMASGKSAALSITLLLLASMAVAQAKTAKGIKNIVIVHGAFVDASGWEPVYTQLVRDGYTVSLVQNPTSSLAEDTAATNAVIDRQDGPVLLVGHSWGGTVITESGNDPKVKALVYICAFIPDAGESTLDLVKNAKPLKVQGILPPDARGNVWLAKATFRETFTPGVTVAKSDFLYDAQVPLTVKAFTDKISKAAWRSKPVYAIKPSNDGTISPPLEDMMYKRAHAKITHIEGGHTFFLTRPAVAVAVIEAAARAN